MWFLKLIRFQKLHVLANPNHKISCVTANPGSCKFWISDLYENRAKYELPYFSHIRNVESRQQAIWNHVRDDDATVAAK